MQTATQLETDNKALVRSMIKRLPRRSRYATRVLKNLEKKGVTVSLAMVYQNANGRTYNLDIFNAITDVYEQFLKEEQELNKRLKSVANS